MSAGEEDNDTSHLLSKAGGDFRTYRLSLALLTLASAILSVIVWYVLSRNGSIETKNRSLKRTEQPRDEVRSHRVIEIIAIGDVHGDYNALHNIFQRVGIIDDNHDWSGGNVTVIQTGDQQDKGSREGDVYELLFKLQDQAPHAGGKVHILYGNHEVRNAQLDFRQVTAKGFIDLAGTPSDYVPLPIRKRIRRLAEYQQPRAWAVAPGGELSRRMAHRMNVSVVRMNIAFVHGGLTPENARIVPRLNEETRRLMLGERTTFPPELCSHTGPVWLRTYSRDDIDPGGWQCAQAEEALEVLGARAMVMGHTVQREGINSRCNGRVWRIDTGMSAHFGGEQEALLIYSDGSTAIVTETEVLDGELRSF